MFYIQVVLLKEGRNFSPFSCLIFKWLPTLEPNVALLDSMTIVIGPDIHFKLYCFHIILFKLWYNYF